MSVEALDRVEFDCPFRVTPDGRIVEPYETIYAPDYVYWDEATDRAYVEMPMD